MGGGWLLDEVVTAQGVSTSATKLGYSQYMERKYDGWVVRAGNTQRTEIDSVTIYRDKQIVFQSRMAQRVRVDVEGQYVVYQLTNGQYYKVHLIFVEGIDDGTGNDKLWVSELVNSPAEINAAATYRYTRTNMGKRPW